MIFLPFNGRERANHALNDHAKEAMTMYPNLTLLRRKILSHNDDAIRLRAFPEAGSPAQINRLIKSFCRSLVRRTIPAAIYDREGFVSFSQRNEQRVIPPHTFT